MLHPRLLQVLTHSCPTRRSSDLFERHYRYTGSALTSDSAWLFGAGFAPFWALVLAAYFGFLTAGLYLLSGALATLIALWISKTLATGRFEDSPGCDQAARAPSPGHGAAAHSACEPGHLTSQEHAGSPRPADADRFEQV